MGINQKKAMMTKQRQILNIFGMFLLASFVLVGCADDDDNGNVIDQETCDDGIQNGDETGVDCGGSCPPCDDSTELDFSGTFVQVDVVGRPAVNTVFGGSNLVKNNYNITAVNDREIFQPTFEETLEAYHDVYGDALGVEIDYETNILGWDAATFTSVLAFYDALQVAPEGPTTYFDGTNLLTGRRLSDDVVDISLVLTFGGEDGARFDGNNDTPQLTSDGVGPGDRDFGLPFPYLETPILE